MKLSSLLSLLLVGVTTAAPIKIGDDDGLSIEAHLIRFTDEDSALLRRVSDGKEFETKLSLFNKKSQKLLRSTWAKQQEVQEKEVSPLNEAVGHSLSHSSLTLFEEPAADIAKRLRWPLESKTPYTSSYRRYTNSKYRFFGARPYSVVVYGNDQGFAESLSLVFANKGDSLSKSGAAEDHFDEDENKKIVADLEKAMKADTEAISSALTQLYGEGTKQRFGERNSRRSVTRWDWRGHSFLLTSLEGEYVGLQIVPTQFADNSGRAERLSDAQIQKRLDSNIVKKDNGDVYIVNIPMVDQGPKGYCVPATFERAMRYAGVPADMYLLATLATAPGGGTNTHKLFREVRSVVSSKGRRAREEKLSSMKLRTIKSNIDKGIPIMWTMRSLDLYNDTANARTKERQSVTDWSAYADKIADEAESNAPNLSEEDSHHICMIIGYNEQTQELAVSDSWGKRYTMRWIHIDEAEAVSSGSAYVIKR